MRKFLILYYDTIKKLFLQGKILMRDTELFNGMNEYEFNEAMKNINAGEFKYRKNQIILQAGDITQKMGFILNGSVSIESNDIFGNTTLLNLAHEGEYFAEVYALSGMQMLVDVRANENCRILFITLEKINTFHSWALKLNYNLLQILARKNLHLSERSFINANKSIRRKVMSYLNSISLKDKKHKRDIIIPLNRQQMADYLNIDRSALSKKLCSMRDEGIIEFQRNHFILLKEGRNNYLEQNI